MRLGPRRTVVIGALLPVFLVLIATMARADETTVSGNTLRTGWDSHEPALTPAKVASASVGQLFVTNLPEVVGNPESGRQRQQVYAQPLIADGYLIIATEENHVYGLNPVTGAIRWSTDLGPSWPVSTIGCTDLLPDIGVTSTPVYDPSNHNLYVLNKTYSGKRSGVTKPVFQLHALNIVNGRQRKGWPVTIKGYPTNSPTVPFSPERQLQRPGLLLLGGVIYAGFAAHCNPLQYGPNGRVDGYVAGVSASRPRLTTLWSTEAGYATAGGGVWQSGGGLVSDGPNSIFVATGNGLIAPPTGPGDRPPGTLADAVLHLRVQPNGSLKPVDFFGPTDNTQLNRDDTDVASGGPLAIPAGYGTRKYPDLLVQMGKDGRIWLLNRNDLGGVGQGKNHGNDALGVTGPVNGVWGHPAFFGGNKGYIYYVPYQSPMDAFELGSSHGVPRLTFAGQTTVPKVLRLHLGFPRGHIDREVPRERAGVGRLLDRSVRRLRDVERLRRGARPWCPENGAVLAHRHGVVVRERRDQRRAGVCGQPAGTGVRLRRHQRHSRGADRRHGCQFRLGAGRQVSDTPGDAHREPGRHGQ